jgi:RNA polymerase sigma factor (sigma-70 family)
LGRFDERSKFSTYVQGIAKNKINEELETRMIRRERFYVSGDNPEEDINLRDAKAEVAFGNVVQAVDLERLDRWAKELQPKDYCVWECLRDGMTMKATAEKLGISEDSAENSLRRKVRPHLRKKYLREPDGKDLLSATNSTRGEF